MNAEAKSLRAPRDAPGERLKTPRAYSGGRRRAVKAPRPAPLRESHIQQTVTEFLEWDGWRPIRTEHAIERDEDGGFKRRVGEVGMPDYLFVRYDTHISTSWAQVLWIEFKRPGERPRWDQEVWHVTERLRGALVLVVDSIDDFRAWYAASGLQRAPQR